MAQRSSPAVSPGVGESAVPTSSVGTSTEPLSALQPVVKRGRQPNNPVKRGRGRPRKHPEAPKEPKERTKEPKERTKEPKERTKEPKERKEPKEPKERTKEPKERKEPKGANPPKRGRGRPRKDRPETSQPKPAASKAKPKPKAAAPPVSGGEAPKRGRGRPRKNALPPAAAEVTTSEQEDPPFDPGNLPSSTAGEGGAPVVKKKRGRAKKATQDGEGPSAAKKAKIQPVAATESQGGATKKRVGRPKKTNAEGPKPRPAAPADSSAFRLKVPVSFEASSSDGEVGEHIASLVSRNGVLQDRTGEPTQKQQQQQGESSDSSYTTPEPNA